MEWSPPTQYYQTAYQPASQVNTSGEWAPPPSFYQPAPNTVPTETHQAPWSLPDYQPAPPMPLELIIPPKYNGDVINKGSGKMYHLRTTDIHSTSLSDTSGNVIGRIDWKKNPVHTVVNIRRNTWQRDQLLHMHKDK
jgi:hypothetical protein